MLEAGDRAPEFALRNQFGETVELAALRGAPVVVVFYPAAFTGRCTSELCELRDNLAMFTDQRVTLLAISTDPVATLARFADEEGYGFSLLSDFWPHGEVSRAYDAFLPERGVATRATFVIDREGTIAATFRTEPTSVRALSAYRDAVAALV